MISKHEDCQERVQLIASYYKLLQKSTFFISIDSQSLGGRHLGFSPTHKIFCSMLGSLALLAPLFFLSRSFCHTPSSVFMFVHEKQKQQA